MSLTATYNDTLARVELAGAGLTVVDTFTRYVPTPLNANPFFETTASPWTATGGTVARSTAQAHEGVASLLLTPDGVSANVVTKAELVPGTVGVAYRGSAWVRCAVSRNVMVNIDWRDGGGGLLSVSTSTVAVTADTWTLLEVTATAPASTAQVGLTISMGSTPLVSHLLHIDEAMLTTGGGWGLTDTGETYEYAFEGGATVAYFDVGGVGTVTIAAVDAPPYALLPGTYTDADILARVKVPVTATGGSLEWGFPLRYADTNNFLLAQVAFDIAGTIDVVLTEKVAGVFTTVASATNFMAYTADTYVNVRAQMVGALYRMKVWTGTEPATWTTAGISATYTSGKIGVRSRTFSGNTNTLPLTMTIDDLTVTPTVVVERSIDQVTWTTVRGGAALVPASGAIALDDYEFAADVTNYYRAIGQTANITPTLGGVWLKSLARPFLNRQVTVVDYSDVTRASRTGVFPVVGRSFPVAVTDLHHSRQWTLDVLAATLAEAEDIDLLISTGEVQFVHVPADSGVPGGYVALGDTTERRPGRRSTRRVFSLPFTAVAAPGADVIPAVGTWQTVVNNYADWSALVADKATWNDVLELVGSAQDVIVG